MSNIKQFQEATEVLQNVDVSEIFTSLALGIAKAQEKLDSNSIKQLIALSEQEVAGKSLLELGFYPAFYSFAYADVSASIELKMRLNTKTSLKVNAYLDYAKAKGYTSESVEKLEVSKKDTVRKEYKSSRSYIKKIDSSEEVVIQNKTIKFDQTESILKRINSYYDKALEAESVVRFDHEITEAGELTNISATGVGIIWNNGFIVVNVPSTKKFGIVKMGNPSVPNAIDIKASSTFTTVANDFAATVLAATGVWNAAGQRVIGFKKAGISAGVYTAECLNVYFASSRHLIDPAYSNTSGGSTWNNVDVFAKLDALAEILKADSTLSIDVIGHTDTEGGWKFNKNLSNNRSGEVKKYLILKGVSSSQINTDGKSEWEQLTGGTSPADDARGTTLDGSAAAPNNTKSPAHRVAKIYLKSNEDLIYIEGPNNPITGASSTAYTGPTTLNNGFYKYGEIATGSRTLNFSHKGTNFVFAGITNIDSFITAFTAHASGSKYQYEKVHETVHLIHEESSIKFTAYNLDSEEITITTKDSSSETTSNSASKVLIDETVNSKYYLKQDTEKLEDPSALAVGGSVDFRTCRQFEMSLTGNAQMSARLISVPAPDGFKAHIRNLFGLPAPTTTTTPANTGGGQ
jgi:hypothetical protein